MASNNALVNAYRKGFQEGRKYGDRVVELDFQILMAAMTVGLKKSGMDADQLGELVNGVNDWLVARKGKTPDELLQDASDETGFDIRLKGEQ